MRKLLGAAGWLTAGVGIGVGALAGFTAWTLNGPRRPWPNYTFTPFELDVPFDDIAFTAPDGVPLAGWWMDRPASPIVVICAHGHRGNKSDMLGIGTGLWRASTSLSLGHFSGEMTSAPPSQS